MADPESLLYEDEKFADAVHDAAQVFRNAIAIAIVNGLIVTIDPPDDDNMFFILDIYREYKPKTLKYPGDPTDE